MSEAPPVHYLFAYGSLQQESVQLYAFGRLLEGEPDELAGYALTVIDVEEADPVGEAGTAQYKNVAFNGRSESVVTGTVFAITDAELDAADRYEEPAAYTRQVVTLASGKAAWVYARWPAVPAGTPRPVVTVRDHPGLWWLLALLFIGAGGAILYLGIVSASNVPWWQSALAMGMGVAAVTAGVTWAWRSPLSVVKVDPAAAELRLTQYGLFGRHIERFPLADIRDVVVERQRDDEGAMTVRPALVLSDGRREPLSELWRHDPAGVARVIATLRRATGARP
jgi:gamma-glutamylcyclotransferase (GGCT)/AIG2-like uncharacterized protein YtfP